MLETNLDDVTGEQLGHAVAAALEAGALDAWVSPVTMKKGRPGHVLHVLTDATHLGALRTEIERVTGTMGVRATAVERWPLGPELEQVTVDGITVRMKVSQRACQARVRRRRRGGGQDGRRPARGRRAGPRRRGGSAAAAAPGPEGSTA